ncbi:hypothetical protein ACWESM_10380, partial [Nocardia sp. NPDC003999]
MSASLDNGPELPSGLVELVGPVDPVGVGWLPVESKPLLDDEGGRPLVGGLAPSLLGWGEFPFALDLPLLLSPPLLLPLSPLLPLPPLLFPVPPPLPVPPLVGGAAVFGSTN